MTETVTPSVFTDELSLDEESRMSADRRTHGTLSLCAAILLMASASAAIKQTDSPPHPETKASQGGDIFMGVRILKAEGAGDLKWAAELPPDCSGCRLMLNQFTSGTNAREIYFHFVAPGTMDTVRGIHVKIDPAKVRAVLVGRERITFGSTRDGITFDAPLNGPRVSELGGYWTLPAYGAGDVTDQYTYLDQPGVETRVEHADEKRRNGPYATGPWPATQRQAALNLEFGSREAISALGLDRMMTERGLGTILLMGFDTNFPTQGPEVAHADDPPHWHMHISWTRQPIIRQVGHFYIGPDGLLIQNVVADPASDHTLQFEKGQTFDTVTLENETLYSQTITREGYFVLAAAKGSCKLSPISEGFQSGVALSCNEGKIQKRVRAQDDIQSGRLRVFVNDHLKEEHLYDPDNGVLKSSKIVYELPGERTRGL